MKGPPGPQGDAGPAGTGTWRGEWSGIATYTAGDLVSHASSAWGASQDSAGASPPNDPYGSSDYWTLVAPGGAAAAAINVNALRWRGPWSPGAFAPNDVTTRNGFLYRCKQGTDTAPTPSAFRWELMFFGVKVNDVFGGRTLHVTNGRTKLVDDAAEVKRKRLTKAESDTAGVSNNVPLTGLILATDVTGDARAGVDTSHNVHFDGELTAADGVEFLASLPPGVPPPLSDTVRIVMVGTEARALTVTSEGTLLMTLESGETVDLHGLFYIDRGFGGAILPGFIRATYFIGGVENGDEFNTQTYYYEGLKSSSLLLPDVVFSPSGYQQEVDSRDTFSWQLHHGGGRWLDMQTLNNGNLRARIYADNATELYDYELDAGDGTSLVTVSNFAYSRATDCYYVLVSQRFGTPGPGYHEQTQMGKLTPGSGLAFVGSVLYTYTYDGDGNPPTGEQAGTNGSIAVDENDHVWFTENYTPGDVESYTRYIRRWTPTGVYTQFSPASAYSWISFNLAGDRYAFLREGSPSKIIVRDIDGDNERVLTLIDDGNTPNAPSFFSPDDRYLIALTYNQFQVFRLADGAPLYMNVHPYGDFNDGPYPVSWEAA